MRVATLIAGVALGGLTAIGCAPIAERSAAPDATEDDAALAPLPQWPRWLQSADRHPDQTSGLAFVGRGAAGERVFLAADDVGGLWRLSITPGDASLLLEPIDIVGAAAESLARFPKKDLESITVCPLTSRVLISIEGRNPPGEESGTGYRRWMGIFEATLDAAPIGATRVTDLTRIALPEWDHATRYTGQNLGFEATDLCGDTLLLGLEGIMGANGELADSTLLEVYDLAAGTRFEAGTHSLGVATITGFARSAAGRYYGIDRNQQRLFSFRIGDHKLDDFRWVQLDMPGVGGIPYRVPSPEAIALDDEGFIWIIIDPWRYEPVRVEGLSASDIENYERGVPLIYKYRDPFVGGSKAKDEAP